MSDRIFAVAWLGVCLLIVVQMWNLSVPFSYEPVGPKAFPILLSGLMALCCIALLVQPDTSVQIASRGLLGKGALLLAVLLAYALAFEQLGFLLSTATMVLIVSRVFGGNWLSSAITAVLIAVLAFVVFDRTLNINLPMGLLWNRAS